MKTDFKSMFRQNTTLPGLSSMLTPGATRHDDVMSDYSLVDNGTNVTRITLVESLSLTGTNVVLRSDSHVGAGMGPEWVCSCLHCQLPQERQNCVGVRVRQFQAFGSGVGAVDCK